MSNLHKAAQAIVNQIPEHTWRWIEENSTRKGVRVSEALTMQSLLELRETLRTQAETPTLQDRVLEIKANLSTAEIADLIDRLEMLRS